MNVLFLHIPKNAGTSIRTCLVNNNRFNYPFWMHNHLYLSQLEKRCEYYNFIPDYKFCVVRNPYTRILSIYNHVVSKPTIQVYKNHDKWVTNKTRKTDYEKISKFNFDEWLNYFLFESKGLRWSVTTEQSVFINGTKDIEIFKFEDLKKLQKKLKIYLLNHNAGNYNKSIKISQESKKLIELYYKEDFERFDYD